MEVAFTLESGAECTCSCAHAPHNEDQLEINSFFWELAARKINLAKQRRPYAFLILFIDANARVGSVESPFLGLYGGDVENQNGEFFRIMLETTGLDAVNTFMQYETTWTSTYGTVARIDYVCINRHQDSAIVSSGVTSAVDHTLAGHEDHRVLVAQICTSVQKATGLKTSPAKQFSFDKIGLTVQWKVDRFQSMLCHFGPLF